MDGALYVLRQQITSCVAHGLEGVVRCTRPSGAIKFRAEGIHPEIFFNLFKTLFQDEADATLFAMRSKTSATPTLAQFIECISPAAWARKKMPDDFVLANQHGRHVWIGPHSRRQIFVSFNHSRAHERRSHDACPRCMFQVNGGSSLGKHCRASSVMLIVADPSCPAFCSSTSKIVLPICTLSVSMPWSSGSSMAHFHKYAGSIF